MPTPADLRRALDDLGAEAPHPARTRTAVLHRVGSPPPVVPGGRRREQLGGPLLAAAVSLLVALATVVALGLRGAPESGQPADRPTAPPASSDVDRPSAPPSSGPATPPATPLVWTFDLPDPPAGTRFERSSITVEQQTGSLTRPGRFGAYTITVRPPAGLADADLRSGLESPQPVSVDGRPGWFGPIHGGDSGSLVWRTPLGGWAQIDGWVGEAATKPDQVLAGQLTVARLVRFGDLGSPALPFRLGWLPTGVSVSELGVGTDAASVAFADARTEALGEAALEVARSDDVPGGFAAEVDNTVDPGWQELTVDGRPAAYGTTFSGTRRFLAVDAGDGSVLFVRARYRPADPRYPLEVLRRVAEEADVRMPMADPRSWVPAPAAVRG